MIRCEPVCCHGKANAPTRSLLRLSWKVGGKTRAALVAFWETIRRRADGWGRSDVAHRVIVIATLELARFLATVAAMVGVLLLVSSAGKAIGLWDDAAAP